VAGGKVLGTSAEPPGVVFWGHVYDNAKLKALLAFGRSADHPFGCST